MHGVKFRETEPRPSEVRSDGGAGLVLRHAVPGSRVAVRAKLVPVLRLAAGVEVAGEGEDAEGVVPGEVLALGVGLAKLLAVLDVLREREGGKLRT